MLCLFLSRAERMAVLKKNEIFIDFLRITISEREKGPKIQSVRLNSKTAVQRKDGPAPMPRDVAPCAWY